jgi:hypothetical protein
MNSLKFKATLMKNLAASLCIIMTVTVSDKLAKLNFAQL